jgi:hypothetical protein
MVYVPPSAAVPAHAVVLLTGVHVLPPPQTLGVPPPPQSAGDVQ